jgi:hypothetical protein
VLALGTLATKTTSLPERAVASLHAVRATAKAIGEQTPAHAAALLTCVTGPVATAGKHFEEAAEDIAAAKRVVDGRVTVAAKAAAQE